VNSGRRVAIVRVATRALKALRISSIPLRPRCARLTALTARAATRVLQLSTARMEVLDDGRQRRCCRSIFAGCCSQPPPHRPMWSMFGSAVSDHGSFLNSQLTTLVVCSCDVTSAKPTIESDCASVLGQAQIRPCTARPNHHAATAMRLSEVDASGDALSAPITVNNNGIDARNGQAYHGRKTTTTNGTRPALARSCSSERQRAKRERYRRLTSRVRPCAGAPGRA
jgi:hypothetical protein